MSGRSALTIGTAGHIDHGKTSLVRALTGIDTDRLPQEKDRGITIDLGFAHLDMDGVRVGIVDVPGHERFIRNMLAGASGIGAGLLVVAADDSVMPQTREHLAILEALRVPAGLIAITKCDVAEPDWLDMVEQDVRALVRDTFLEGSPIVRTSASSGEGIDALREGIRVLAREHESRASSDVVRLPVDRSFVVQGIGTVVTGTLWSGRIDEGMELEWLPAGRPVRVRGIHSHGEKLESVSAGQRVALNLPDLHHSEIERGQELATTGVFRPSRRLTVGVRALKDCPWAIRNRSRVRLHIGTAEVMAGVKLLDRESLEPGESGVAQLLCAQPVVARGRQPIVLRSESPLVTIASGVVVDPDAPPLKRPSGTVLERLGRVDSDECAGAGAWVSVNRTVDARELVRNAGLAPGSAEAALAGLIDRGEVVRLGGDVAVHSERLADLSARIESWLAAFHENNPLETSAPRERLERVFPRVESGLFEAVLVHMVEKGTLIDRSGGIGLASAGPQLTKSQESLLAQIEQELGAAGFQPPMPPALAQSCGWHQRDIDAILKLAVGLGRAVHVGSGVHVTPGVEADMRERVTGHLERSGSMTMADLRDLFGTSRKYAVPFGEYLDRIGLTKRRGDARVLAKAPAVVTGGADG